MTTTPTKKTASEHQNSPEEQPQRSRNARAQARHRAKRKAYIEQLEETVTKLQTALNLSPEQVAAMPPAQVRIRELEQDNMRLRSENATLRVQLDHYTRSHSPNSTRRDPMSLDDSVDRDKKRRRLSGEIEGVYLTPGDTPPHVSTSLTRPQLSLPLPHTHHAPPYGHSLSSHGSGGTGLFSAHPAPFQLPSTPSASSSASTPSFTASNNSLPPLEPARGRPVRANSLDPSDFVRSVPPNQQPHSSAPLTHSSNNSHSHMHLPPPQVPNHYGHALPSFSHSPHYDVVPKSEDDYHLQSPQNTHFSPAVPSFGSSESQTGNWHVYSAERAPIQHR